METNNSSQSNVVMTSILLECLPAEWRMGFGLLFVITCALTVIENGIVLMTLYRYPLIRTNSNRILAGLAVADFLTGLTVASTFSAQLLNETILTNKYMQLASDLLTLVLVNASMNTKAFISFDRCYHMVKLTATNLSQRTINYVLLVCWIIPIFILIPDAFIDRKMSHGYFVAISTCFVLCIIIIFYGIIISSLHHLTKTHHDTLHDAYVTNERKASHTVVIIISLYIVMFIPGAVSQIIYLTGRYDPTALSKLFTLGVFLEVSNALVNPAIYCTRTPCLRRHIRKVLRRAVVSKKRTHPAPQQSISWRHR